MKGYIEVVLPEGAQGITLSYAKVAELEELNEASATKLLQEGIEYEESITVRDKNTVQITDLEEGVYQIQAFADAEYEFMPSLVSVPFWNEEEKEMQYHLTVIPKYTRHVEVQEIVPTTIVETSPKTRDAANTEIYSIFGVISFIIVMIISCHNRFKCGRMSHMYKKRRRT